MYHPLRLLVSPALPSLLLLLCPSVYALLDDGEAGCTADLDCASYACARQTASPDAPLVCCESAWYVFVNPALGNVCTWQSNGALCPSNRNELCLNNVCVDDICQDDQRLPGEPCDNHSDCITYQCGKQLANASDESVCCSSGVNAIDLGEEQGWVCDTAQIGDDEEDMDDKDNDECIKSIDIIQEKEALVSDSSNLRTYTLCPGEYKIGTYDVDNQQYINGMAALEIYQSNIFITCAEQKEGACRLVGGKTQIAVFNKPDRDAFVKNVRVRGIDFTRSQSANAAFFARGQVTFEDCRFYDNEGPGILDIIGGNLADKFSLSLERCSFGSNFITSSLYPEDSIAALIYNRQQKLQLRDCTFYSNDFGPITSNELGSAIIVSLEGGTTLLANSCFSNNNADTAVLGVATHAQNYASGFCSCEGVLTYQGDCQTFDKEMCSADMPADDEQLVCNEVRLPEQTAPSTPQGAEENGGGFPGDQALKQPDAGTTQRPTGRPTEEPVEGNIDASSSAASTAAWGRSFPSWRFLSELCLCVTFSFALQ